MNFAVLQFPGSNCDQDCVHILKNVMGHSAKLVWHKDTTIGNVDAVLVPGGFSYGDYLRTGAIARFSPVMQAVQQLTSTRPRPAAQAPRGPWNSRCMVTMLPGGIVSLAPPREQQSKWISALRTTYRVVNRHWPRDRRETRRAFWRPFACTFLPISKKTAARCSTH